MILRSLISLFCVSSYVLLSQLPATIRVKRNSELIYFFQKDLKTDTITKNKGNLFYLFVPDSIKEFISVQTENGMLEPNKGDSLLRFNFLKGLKYELIYAFVPETGLKKHWSLQSRINGAADEQGNRVLITLIDRRRNHVLIESRFRYKE